MEFSVDQLIAAPRAAVWDAITDIENAAERIEAIQQVEVLANPEDSLIGFKWREVRTMFGKQAEETMWIVAAEPQRFYQTRAESHGSVYTSRLSVEDAEGSTRLTMSFEAAPQSVGAKIMSATIGRLFVGATKKAMLKDLDDIKASVESKA